MNSRPYPATLGVIGAGRVGRAVTAAVVTTGLVSTVLVHSRRLVESTALATDATDLAATQRVPIRIDAVELDRTQHGPAGAVLSTVRKLLGLADGHEELSAPSPSGVYLGQRLRFVAGRYWKDPPEHSAAEQTALDASAHRLKILYGRVKTHL